jgi:LPXTG-motif cell wall-anchored protein
VGIVGAAELDKKTTITTQEAMQLPNTMLQPGTYVIKLADSDSNRHIVQFFDKDEKHLITTILAIPNERVRPTGKSVFAFWEVPAGQPKALRAWFYPGDNFGQEFAYPKLEADRISASNNNTEVPIKEDDSAAASKTETASITTAEPVSTEPAPPPAPVEIAAAPQQEPPPAPAVTPEPVTPAAPVTVDRDDAQKANREYARTTAERLPKTASNMPLFGLIGLLAIGSALALRGRVNVG